MFRFMAFVWNPADTEQSRAAQVLASRLQSASRQWHSAFHNNGIEVYCADARQGGSEPHLLTNHGGVVVGTLFSSTTSTNQASPKRDFNDAESQRILATEGRDLIDSYWGRYVAFLVHQESRKTWIIKDPTGNLPCLSTSFRGMSLFFSCLEDCTRLELCRFSINWEFVHARVATGWVGSSGTGLREVSDVARGECVEIGADRSNRRLYWNPLTVAQDGALEDAEEAARTLRSTAKACAHAWTTSHERLLHRLSGGLDSSIVLGCAHDAPNKPKITCLTYYVPDGYSDERPWARLAARHAGCTHVERPRTPAIKLEDVQKIRPMVEPEHLSPYLETGPIERQLAADVGATAVFTGHGGDAIFGRHPREFAATDFVQRHGIRPSLLGVARDLALLVNESVWTILYEAARSRVFKYSFGRQRELFLTTRKLVTTEVLGNLFQYRSFPHPWFESLTNVPWGVIQQIGMLVQRPAFYDPLSDPEASDPEPTYPLMSQPMIEVCLRIPLYMHIAGGHDRSLARRAFKQDLPREISSRQWKDRAPGFFEEMVRANLRFIRSFLLDGALVRERLLDRAKLLDALSGAPTKSIGWVSEVLDHVCVEAWLRTWSGSRGVAA